MQIPLIIRAPRLNPGQRTAALTETIDLYPTLCELSGLETPSHLEGQSLLSVLHDPAGKSTKPAIGRYQNGDTIRTDTFRYTRYSDKSDKKTASMLYNHNDDHAEDHNVVESPELAADAKKLESELQKHKGK